MPDTRRAQSVAGSLDRTSIDRDLAALLSIDPSPEFAAGVRRRVDGARASHPVPFRWWAAGAAVAALALLAAFLPRAPQVETPRVATTRPSDVVLEAPAAAHPIESSTRRPRAASAGVRRAPESPAEPEVLVPADRLRAIARLQELIVAGALTEADLPRRDSAPAAAVDIQPAPLTILPLIVPDVAVVAGPAAATGQSRR
jgi:hypothetical protein